MKNLPIDVLAALKDKNGSYLAIAQRDNGDFIRIEHISHAEAEKDIASIESKFKSRNCSKAILHFDEIDRARKAIIAGREVK